jgi:uncharacterized protein YbbC (DUF1343 family)
MARATRKRAARRVARCRRAGAADRTTGVLTGADVLARENCARLVGRKVALLTNRTGRLRSGERTIDLLARTKGVELRSILAPEHGLGARAEGSIADEIDTPTGLVIHSLYGATRKPTAEMLEGCDTLVIDLQHVGTRIYTYESTLAYAMEVAGFARTARRRARQARSARALVRRRVRSPTPMPWISRRIARFRSRTA